MIFERSIEELLEFDYDLLKSYLLQVMEAACKKILANDEIKHKLIDNPKRYNFIWLAQEQNDYIIPSLLEGNGLNILANTTEVVDKLNGIITSGQEYLTDLFKNSEFIALVLNHHQSLSYLYSEITSEAAYNFVEHLIDMKTDIKLLTEIICLVNKQAQIKIVETLNLPDEIFWDLVINMNPKASDILMKNNSVGKHLNDFNLTRLDALFKQEIFLPSDIIEDKKFMKSFTTMLDVKAFRILMINLEKANDVDLIEQKRKSFYEIMIDSYDEENQMLSIFNELYLSLKNLLNTSTVNLGFVYNSLVNVIPNKLDSEYLYTLDLLISEINNINPESLLSFFQKLSNLELTNMIIDYHFEDVYFNVLKDIEILFKFYESGGLSLNEEDYKLYNAILHLDKLSYLEKIKLHEKMKSYDFKEKFYDDVRNAKNMSYQMINDSILNAERVKKYKNEELSKGYGVDVYVLEGEPFSALVKSFGVSKSQVLKTHFVINNSPYGSFSLDGSDKLETYNNPRDYYNILYDGMSPEQIIHTFSVDSFTSRPSKYDNNFTDRFNEILTPSSLINNSDYYNEILIRQASLARPLEIDERIPVPKIVSLYCYDEITENDIESARNLGIGITLVLTRNYSKKTNIDRINMFDTITLGNSNNVLKNNYLNNIQQDAMYGRR